MPSTRKFYKTVIVTTVLSEYPLDGLDTSEIHREGGNGDCSLVNDRTKGSEEIDGPTAAKLLIEQNSDPEIFQLDEDGNELDEDHSELEKTEEAEATRLLLAGHSFADANPKRWEWPDEEFENWVKMYRADLYAKALEAQKRRGEDD